jgi:hypothetical protein
MEDGSYDLIQGKFAKKNSGKKLKYITHHSLCPSHDSKWTSSVYKLKVLLVKPTCWMKILKFKTEKSMFKSRFLLKLIKKIRGLQVLAEESFRSWQLLRQSKGEAEIGQTKEWGATHEAGENDENVMVARQYLLFHGECDKKK